MSVDRVWDVAVRDNLVASCSSNKTVSIWNPSNQTKTTEIDEGHTRSIRSVCFRPVGTPVVASGSFDATIGIWAFEDGEWEFLAQLEGHENEIKSVSWSFDGRFLASCSRDKSVWVWEVDEDCEDFECVAVLTDHTQDVKHVSWHPNELLLASSSYDDLIRLWAPDDDEWVCVADLKGHESTVWGCDFEPREGSGASDPAHVPTEPPLVPARLVSCSDDLTVRVWKRVSQSGQRDSSSLPSTARWESLAEEWVQEAVLPKVHTYTVYAVKWSKYGIASVGADGRVVVYEEKDGKWNVKKVIEKAHGVYEVNTVNWWGDKLVTGGDDGEVRFWSAVDATSDAVGASTAASTTEGPAQSN